jgi:uncharacterized membrane protein
MATTKKEEPTTEQEVKSLRSELDAITFKNKQAQDIAAMNAGKERLKDKLASNRRRRVASSDRVSGLGKLSGLANFKSK